MVQLHNDEPTLCDRLNRTDMVIRVGDDVAQCDPPTVFGVHGEWGSGKTSFLHQLHKFSGSLLALLFAFLHPFQTCYLQLHIDFDLTFQLTHPRPVVDLSNIEIVVVLIIDA